MLERITGHLLARLVALGLTPVRWPGTACGTVLLDVKGRSSGRLHSNLVTWVQHDGGWYLVSMPGAEPHWVKNMRAAGGTVVLRHGRRRSAVHLEELPRDQRAPVLQAWYRFTGVSTPPRQNFQLDRRAPLEAFEPLAASHPVFRIARASRGHAQPER